ncbi:hypothetical protein C8J57DRAFT_1326150, partial [Mycena rebaudengoi]
MRRHAPWALRGDGARSQRQWDKSRGRGRGVRCAQGGAYGGQVTRQHCGGRETRDDKSVAEELIDPPRPGYAASPETAMAKARGRSYSRVRCAVCPRGSVRRASYARRKGGREHPPRSDRTRRRTRTRWTMLHTHTLGHSMQGARHWRRSIPRARIQRRRACSEWDQTRCGSVWRAGYAPAPGHSRGVQAGDAPGRSEGFSARVSRVHPDSGTALRYVL